MPALEWSWRPGYKGQLCAVAEKQKIIASLGRMPELVWEAAHCGTHSQFTAGRGARLGKQGSCSCSHELTWLT